MGVDQNDGKYYYRCHCGTKLQYAPGNLAYSSSYYMCSLCSGQYQYSISHYYCASCSRNYCSSCADQYKPMQNPKTLCHLGHPLDFQVLKYSGNYVCDQCGRRFPSKFSRWCCPACQYDICSFCRLPPTVSSFSAPVQFPVQQTIQVRPIQIYPQQPIHLAMQVPIYRPVSVPVYQPVNVARPVYNPVPPPVHHPVPMPQPVYNPVPGDMPGPLYNPYDKPVITEYCNLGHVLAPTQYSMGYIHGKYTCRRCGEEYYCEANARYSCIPCRYDVCMGCKN